MKRKLVCILFFLIQQVSLALCAQFYENETKGRYDIVESFASRYKRPFTALEVAACSGDYSFYLAKQYRSSVFVMIEGNESHCPRWASQLLARCNVSQLSNVILLGDLARPAQIQRMGECEHFDLVFSFCVIERAGTYWKELFDAMMTLGDHLILEVLNSQSHVQKYIEAQGAQAMALLTASTLYYIPCNKDRLKRKTWLRTLASTITIQSTFTEKKLIKKTPHHATILTSDWKPGINLITFKMCHGIYPSMSTVKKALSDIKYVWHNDWAMHNIIIQGDSLALIDYGDPRMQGRDQSRSELREKTYQKIIRCLDLINPKDVEAFYWKYLKTRATQHRIKKLLKTIFRLS